MGSDIFPKANRVRRRASTVTCDTAGFRQRGLEGDVVISCRLME